MGPSFLYIVTPIIDLGNTSLPKVTCLLDNFVGNSICQSLI
jgi:hypothetical protein